MGDTNTPETGNEPTEPVNNPAPETSAPETPTRLPADHPLVKAYDATRTELKALRDAQKSDLERANDNLTEAQSRNVDLEAENVRLRAVIEHKLDLDDMDLLGVGTADEIDARAKRLAERSGGRGTTTNNRMPTVGTGESFVENPDRATVRQIFGG